MLRLSLLLVFFFVACDDAPGPASSIQTGAGPNAMVVIERHDQSLLAVAASLDSTVQFFSLPNLQPAGSVFFAPNRDKRSPNPWALAASPDGNTLAVSLYDDHSVALIDVAQRKIVATLMPTPAASYPTALRFVGADLFVLFTNRLAYAELNGLPSRYNEGTLVRFRLEQGAARFTGSVVLPCQNPAALEAESASTLAIACQGNAFFDGAHHMQLKEGAALIRVDTQSLNITSTIALSRFAPSQIVKHPDGLLMASAVKRQLLLMPTAAHSDDEAILLALNADNTDEPGYMSALFTQSSNKAIAADFKNDHLYSIDLRVPFGPQALKAPLRLKANEDALLFRGPQALAQTENGRLYVLTSLSAEVMALQPDESWL